MTQLRVRTCRRTTIMHNTKHPAEDRVVLDLFVQSSNERFANNRYFLSPYCECTHTQTHNHMNVYLCIIYFYIQVYVSSNTCILYTISTVRHTVAYTHEIDARDLVIAFKLCACLRTYYIHIICVMCIAFALSEYRRPQK